jgi:trimethylamine--corrinoid protein Co-methyltransferase
MASIIAGSDEELRKKPIMSFFGCPEAALYFGEVADMIINAASKRLPVSILPTVIAGGTSPVTLAGTLVQSTAEFLAGALMVQLTSPGNPVIISTAPVNLNMKTGTPLLGTMEFGLMIAGVAQIAKYFKIPSNVYGFGSDSKTLDEQVAFEKAFLLTLSAMAGADIIYGPGVLESDVTNSYEQVIIDCELLENIQRLMKGIRVEEETLAVNIIAKVGPRGHYLKEEHTRRLFRQEYFIPHLADRTPRLVWEKAGSKDVVAKAREEVKRILAEHQPPQLPEVTVKELKDILHTVEKETLSFQ